MDFFKDININNMDLPYILFLLTFTILITVNMIKFNNQIGIFCSDVYIYLLNSLNFAGINIEANNTMYLSPVICMITSLFFRLGYVNENAIYIVTGIFAIIGNLGFYILLKNRFNKTLSLIGSVLLFSFSLNLLWLANGTLDIPAIGLTIWTLIFFIAAMDKNHKYYLIALPLLVLSFFTRYTTILILPAILFYFFTKHDFLQGLDNLISDRKSLKKSIKNFIKSDELKSIIKGLIISIILIATFLIVINYFVTNLSFFSQSSAVNSGLKTNVIDTAYTTDTFFYITNFLNFLFSNKITFYKNIPTLYNPSIIAYLVMFITIFGLIIGLLRFKNIRKTNLNGLEDYKFENKTKNSTNKLNDYKKPKTRKSEKIEKPIEKELFKTKHLGLILNLFFIITLIFSILTFNHISSVLIVILITIDMLILSKFLQQHKINNPNFNLTMLLWFLTNLIVYSYISIKVNRYILTLMPAFVYFFILGLYYIEKQWNYDLNIFKHKINTSQIIAIILLIIFIFSAFNFTSTVVIDKNIKAPEIISESLKHYDPNYQTKQVGVYNKRPFTWFLKKDLFGIDKYNRGYLKNSNITYYIANEKLDNLTNYHQIINQDNLYIYQRNNITN
jgi:4-amino-4-deoxy-L-arabinose transferase-like glycosyltransferase